MAVSKKDIQVGDKCKYVNIEFIVLEKTEKGVKFKYNEGIYFREYVDIDKIN